jgi:uncharacterized protein YndB with AHSA1/START domain|tara:strand:- start:3201 stop:3674 length:474 start_codon:yes stop_codon:yes gene_type:complete
MSAPVHVHKAYIKASLGEVWKGITDGELTSQYRGPCHPDLGMAEYGTGVQSDWTPGAPVRHVTRDGTVVADGEVIAIDPPNRLEVTFHAHWDPELEAEGPVREVYQLEDEKMGLTRITVELYDAAPDSKSLADTIDHFPFIISGLKTLLETGDPLVG